MSAESQTDVGILRRRIEELMPRAFADLARLVSCRSVADPELAPPEGSAAAVAFLETAFAALGLEVDLLEMPNGTRTVVAKTAGAADEPTVLLYSHYDVQPAADERTWTSPPWTLTERDGRWYGRGAADSKGNIIAHLTALRAFKGRIPGRVVVVLEGSEEWASEGLGSYVLQHPNVFAADAILVADVGNLAVGEPALTVSLRGSVFAKVTVRTLTEARHSGAFGGAAPDACAALLQMLASLWDERGVVRISGLDAQFAGRYDEVSEAAFRAGASVLDEVALMGTGPISERLWLRPAITVLGIDYASVDESIPVIAPAVRARVSLRIPPGVDAASAAASLSEHLRAHAPWNAQVEIELEGLSEGFSSGTAARPVGLWREALRLAYGREPRIIGQGGAIPLCSSLAAVTGGAIILLGVEEPLSAIHAANESVDPGEIERIALAVALFLTSHASR